MGAKNSVLLNAEKPEKGSGAEDLDLRSQNRRLGTEEKRKAAKIRMRLQLNSFPIPSTLKAFLLAPSQNFKEFSVSVFCALYVIYSTVFGLYTA